MEFSVGSEGGAAGWSESEGVECRGGLDCQGVKQTCLKLRGKYRTTYLMTK